MILACIIVDDEPLALDVIRNYIHEAPFLHLAAEFNSAALALDYLKKHPVDLMFLDIKMPRISGMDLAKWVLENQLNGPRVIFTTAYNYYAMDSYRVDAVDYLLKPFGYEDFIRASNKALQAVTYTKKQMKGQPGSGYLFVRVGHQHVKVAFEEIVYVESLKDYVKIHLNGHTNDIVTLSTMRSLEEKLPADSFLRVQRSYIIALDKVSAVSKSSIWIGNTEISVGAQYRSALQYAMKDRL